MVNHRAYLYPWDVRTRREADSLAESGIRRVAVAAVYHAVRGFSPARDVGVVSLSASRAFFPLDDSSWAEAAIRPPTDEVDDFAAVTERLLDAGIQVDAWVVGSHLDGLRPAQEMLVKNAYGQRYEYALCPDHPAVADYLRRVARAASQLPGISGIVAEALGPLGIEHAGPHDKTAGADLLPFQVDALSVCVCAASLAASGLTRAEGATVSDYLRSLSATSVSPSAGHPLVEALLSQRRRAVAGIIDTIRRSTTETSIELAVHTSPDALATGPFAYLDPSLLAGGGPDVAVVSAWDSEQGVARIRKTRALWADSPALPIPRLGAYVTVLPPKAADARGLASEWQTLIAAGADELHVYHLGLASAERRDVALRGLTSLGLLA